MVVTAYRFRKKALAFCMRRVLNEGRAQGNTNMHTIDTLSVEHDVRVDSEPRFVERQRSVELGRAADALVANPRQREIFSRYCDDTIHTRLGGELYEPIDAEHALLFWHHLGTFVAQDGTIYRVRMDDNRYLQMYISPVDERGQSIECIRPYTYDGDVMDDGKVRVDFVNGIHHIVPKNTAEEMRMLNCNGGDALIPIHRSGERFHPQRDALLFWVQNGQVEAVYHDGEHHQVERVFTMAEIAEELAAREEQLVLRVA